MALQFIGAQEGHCACVAAVRSCCETQYAFVQPPLPLASSCSAWEETSVIGRALSASNRYMEAMKNNKVIQSSMEMFWKGYERVSAHGAWVKVARKDGEEKTGSW